MNGSVEMKMQVLDEMIAARTRMLDLQESLGMFSIFRDESILICDTDEFFAYVKHIGAKVLPNGTTPGGSMRVIFTYSGVKFSAHLFADEYQQYQYEIEGGDADVL